ncbi:hypothetical protein ZIOFF_008414 [Zingiber officinale]|uniref:Uncharacterized protein n=1 Tax=Zingiber officinale TaxID=94328 RepID=A0A8J5IG88_ZINOF|nr:hypothetical protein ZIOFF_008414 [Zingiber officinale]
MGGGRLVTTFEGIRRYLEWIELKEVGHGRAEGLNLTELRRAVQQMKTSPMITDEKVCIYECRIATGTQRSYRKSEAIKDKRRSYDARRRKLKASMNDKNAVASSFCSCHISLKSPEAVKGEICPTASSTYRMGCQIQKESMFSKSEHLVATKDNDSRIQSSREATLDLFSPYFHPLLQKTGDANAGFDIEVSAGSGGASPEHLEKENNLDSDVHLYSVSETETIRKATDPALLQYDELGSPMTQSIAKQKGSGCCGKDAKSLGVVQISDVSRGQCTNDLDASNLDIIMEHEECSDSMMKVQMLSLHAKKLMTQKRMNLNVFDLEKLIIRSY